MGYRSDVVIAVYKDFFIEPELGDLSQEDINHINSCRRESTIGSGDVVVFEFGAVKWYKDYAVVHFFIALMDKLDQLVDMNLERVVPYAFVRTGEEVDDIETRGETWEMGFYPVVEIHCDL